MLEKLHIYMSVIAALIVTAVGIAMNMTLAEIGVRLIIAVCAFFVLGLAVKSYLSRRVFAGKAKAAAPGEDQSGDEVPGSEPDKSGPPEGEIETREGEIETREGGQ